MNEYEVYAFLGAPDDTKEISKVLNENKFSRLISVELICIRFVNDKLKFIFQQSQTTKTVYHAKVLQISKKKYSDPKERINQLLENEELPLNRIKKTWEIFKIIDLKNKWLVFLV